MSCVPAPDPSVRWVEACPSAPVIEVWTHTAAVLRIPCHCDARNRIAELIGHHDDERRRQRRARGRRLIVTRAHRHGRRGAGRRRGGEGGRWRGRETGNGRRDCLSTGFAAQDPLTRRMAGGIRQRGVGRNGARSLVSRHERHPHPCYGLSLTIRYGHDEWVWKRLASSAVLRVAGARGHRGRTGVVGETRSPPPQPRRARRQKCDRLSRGENERRSLGGVSARAASC